MGDLTATASALLRLRPSPRLLLTTEDSATDPMATASVLPTPRLTMDSDMDLTDMESAPLTLRPSLRLLPTTDMAATALTAMASAPLMPRLTTEDSDTAPTDMA